MMAGGAVAVQRRAPWQTALVFGGGALLLELALAIAQVQSQVEPSLLVLDEFMAMLDRERRRMMFSTQLARSDG